MEVMLGRRIGSWILGKELGHGGMGAVYEARHVSLNTPAAVKVLSAGLESQEAFRQRFRREAELQSQLRHPNIARVLDYLEDGGQWFLVLEHLGHGSLADRMMRGDRVPRAQAIVWIRQALSALGHAHEKGIVHRDVKPANLMFGPGGEIVVVDFGIAHGGTGPGLTSTGIAIGTPHYMSPEQIVTPGRVDARADIYAIGVVLYELLAGRRPFDGDSEFSILQGHVSGQPAPLRTIDPSIPPALEDAVMRALAKSPDDRYADCNAMAQALERAENTPAAIGGTIQQTAWYPRAETTVAGPPPAELQNRHRRSFVLRVAVVTTLVLVAATMLAIHAARDPETGDGTSSDATDTIRTDSTAPVPEPDPGTVEPPQENGRSKRKRETKGMSVDAAPPPPPPLPPLPAQPQIAIIGGGDDPVFAGLLEQDLERRFADHTVVDERGDPAIESLLNGGDVSVERLVPLLLKGGFHIAVIVRVVEGDKRVFSRLGQSTSHRAVRLHLNAYLLPVNRRIGHGWTETAEYMEGSAVAKAKLALIGQTADLRQAIVDEWSRLRATEAQ